MPAGSLAAVVLVGTDAETRGATAAVSSGCNQLSGDPSSCKQHSALLSWLGKRPWSTGRCDLCPLHKF